MEKWGAHATVCQEPLHRLSVLVGLLDGGSGQHRRPYELPAPLHAGGEAKRRGNKSGSVFPGHFTLRLRTPLRILNSGYQPKPLPELQLQIFISLLEGSQTQSSSCPLSWQWGPHGPAPEAGGRVCP